MSDSLLPFEKNNREVFVKKESRSDPKFGSDPEKRDYEELLDYGICNINKPKGPTSHQVSAYLQEILKINKAGHSGTLDPAVTGVLPIATGKATKIVQVLLEAGKEYIAIMHTHKLIEEQLLRDTINSFVGKIKQLPPLKSAVKRDWRYRKIYYIEILEIQGQDVLMKIGCQAGTYIRKLLHDIGTKLGCGAHMAELIRTKAGPFKFDDTVTLQDVRDALYYYESEKNDKYLRRCILPIEKAAEHLPKLWIHDTAVNAVCHGAFVKVPGVSKVESDIQVGESVAVLSLKGELVAIGTARMISKDIVKKEKGIAVRITKVFMQPDLYPRIER